MKKTIIIVVTAIFLSVNIIAKTNDNSDKIESYISAKSTNIIILNNYSFITKFLSFLEKNIIDANTAMGLRSQVNQIKSYSGVDLLDPNSLESFGIDTTGRIYISISKNNNYKLENSIFIPVRDTKNFPMKFIEFLKKNPKVKPDKYNPVITSQNGHKIYEIERDMFLTTIENYFVVCSTPTAVKMILDKKGKMISKDKNFQKLKNKSFENKDEIHIYNNDFKYNNYLKMKTNSVGSQKKDSATMKMMHGLQINENDFIYHSYFNPEEGDMYKGLNKITDVKNDAEIVILKESSGYGFTKINLKELYRFSKEKPENPISELVKTIVTDNDMLNKLIIDKFHNTYSISTIGTNYYVVFIVDDYDLNNKVRKEIAGKMAKNNNSEVDEIKQGKIIASAIKGKNGKITYIVTAKKYLILSNTLENTEKFLDKKNLMIIKDLESNVKFKITDNYNNVYKMENAGNTILELLNEKPIQSRRNPFMMYLNKIKEILFYSEYKDGIFVSTFIIAN